MTMTSTQFAGPAQLYAYARRAKMDSAPTYGGPRGGLDIEPAPNAGFDVDEALSLLVGMGALTAEQAEAIAVQIRAGGAGVLPHLPYPQPTKGPTIYDVLRVSTLLAEPTVAFDFGGDLLAAIEQVVIHVVVDGIEAAASAVWDWLFG